MTTGDSRRGGRNRRPGQGRTAARQGVPALGLVVGALLLTGGGARAQVPQPAAPAAARPAQTGENPAQATLAEQVEYWRGQSRPDMAITAAERLVASNPRDPDALATAAEIAGELGRTDEAAGFLNTLRRVAPNDPRIGRIEHQRRFSAEDRKALEDARGLAQSGRAADAVARYRELFPNNSFPDNIVPEFYRTLAGIDLAGSREAIAALRGLLEKDPDNARLKLTLAQIQTYRETTRYQGIDTLTTLARVPSVSTAAKAAWRQALLWQGPSGELIEALNTYLASNPTDPQIDQKVVEAKQALPDAATQARMDGFEALNGGDIAKAETLFQTSIAAQGNEPTALAGLGMVRLQQGKLEEARQLRDRAVAIAPEREAEFRKMFDWMGYAYLAQKDRTEAERTFNDSLARDANDAGALAGLGVVRLQEGKLDEARQLRERAIAADGSRKAEFDRMYVGLGFLALRANQMAEAEREFQRIVDGSPDEAPALAGLSYIRARQGRAQEAAALRERALSNAGPQRQELEALLAGGRGGGGGGQGGRQLAGGGRGAPSPSVQARQALERGQLDRADDLARRAARSNSNEQVQAEVILGQIALRRNDATPAEARFRTALARRPGLPEALGGLYESLTQQNRFAEAEALRAEPGFAAAGGSGARRAAALRDEASRAEDPEQALALLAQARALDPDSPWIRLDGIRLLRSQGDEAAAAQEEQALAALPGNDAAYAAALLALDQERYGTAITRLESIPNRLRSADATRLLAQARQQQDIAQLEQQALADPTGDMRQRLLALAARPDPSGVAGAGVVRAFGRLRQDDLAVRAAQAALNSNPGASADARIQLAGALLSARRPAEARQLTDALLREPATTAEQRRQIAELSTGAALFSAGEATTRGDQDAALAELRPALQAMPDSVPVNLALARVYLASNRSVVAQAVADAVLARNPANLEAMTIAADAAMQRRDWPRAEALLAQARARNPADPRVMMLDARLARAQGDYRRALRSLESAGVRRYAQLQADGSRTAAGDAGLLAARLRSSAADTGGAEISDPMAAQIATELAAARQDTLTWIQGGVGFRTRSGSGGLSRLNELTVPVEVSGIVPGLGGRATARAETVVLNAGSLDGGLAARRQYATNPLAGAGTVDPSGTDGRATGVALNVGYAYGAVKADIGTTPLGFRLATGVGGVEYAPNLTRSLVLRLTGERRAVTDSLLSYGGMHDSRAGISWGNVVRTGGRGQLEYAATPDVVLYGGGGYASIDGKNVASNTRFDLGGGIAWTVLRRPDESLVLGVDARYAAHDRNLRYFTLGQGGYFSPQSQFAAVVQADWRKRYGDLRLRLGGAVGWQTYREDDSDVFPNNPSLQAQLVAASAGDASLTTRYRGSSGNGVVGGLRAEVEYDLTRNLRLGALATYDRSGDWNQAAALVRLRYAFDQFGPDLTASAPARP